MNRILKRIADAGAPKYKKAAQNDYLRLTKKDFRQEFSNNIDFLLPPKLYINSFISCNDSVIKNALVDSL